MGMDERGYFLQARGSIRATLCYPLREGLLSRLEESPDVPAVFVDLSQCQYMDSTFIGLLVAMDKRLQKGSGGRLHVLQPSEECLELLRQIGLMDFLLIEDQVIAPPQLMQEISVDDVKPGAEFVLRAHEALMETSDEARKKFALLKEMLERKLKIREASSRKSLRIRDAAMASTFSFALRRVFPVSRIASSASRLVQLSSWSHGGDSRLLQGVRNASGTRTARAFASISAERQSDDGKDDLPCAAELGKRTRQRSL